MTRFDKLKGQITLLAAAIWRPIRENAKKLWANVKPSYRIVWVAFWVPGFLGVLWYGMKVLGKPMPMGGNSYDDLSDYLIEIGARSFPLMVSIAIVYLVAGRLAWNIDNKERAVYQRILTGQQPGSRWGCFAILAGEMLSILSLLVVFLLAMLVWQG